MLCENCGIEAPTKYVAFYQNIGALVMRFSRTLEGDLCKSCIHKTFWSYTTITLLVGWFGTISFFVTPCFILNNFFRYIFCLAMPGVPADAKPPHLDAADAQKIDPHMDYMISRLNQGEDIETVATDTAMRAGVTPGQVILLLRAMISAQQSE